MNVFFLGTRARGIPASKRRRIILFLKTQARIAERRFVAVIAFSRSSVLSIAGAAQAAGARASVIFGKLPPEARRTQLEAARAGRLDVIVCTDVIGHGINLPLDDVVFAETRKFDGVQKRDLRVWEAAQVAGRAGRGETPGHCWIFSKFGAKPSLVRKACAMANGDPVDEDDPSDAGGLDLDRAVLSPDLHALTELCGGEASILLLPNAVKMWARDLAREMHEDASKMPKWVKGGDFEDLLGRLRKLASPDLVPDDVSRALKLADLWHLARLPVSDRHFDEIAEAAATLKAVRPPKPFDDISGEALEDEVQRLGDVIISARRFPGILAYDDASDDASDAENDPDDDDDDDDARLERAEALYLDGSRRVGSQVQACIENSRKCATCGRNKSANAKPSDAHCRSCFLAAQREKQRRESLENGYAATPHTPNRGPGHQQSPYAYRPVVPGSRHSPRTPSNNAPPPPPHPYPQTPIGTPIVLAPVPTPQPHPQQGRGQHQNRRGRGRGSKGGKGKQRDNKPGQFF